MKKEISEYGGGTNYILEIENPEDTNSIALLGRALSSPIRIEILRLLNNGKAMLLSEIAEKLNLQISSTAFHLQVLQEANLLNVEVSTKRKGSLKWYSYGAHKQCTVFMRNPKSTKTQPLPITYHIPIGSFIDAKFSDECGISSETDIIMENNPNDIFNHNKTNAQIIWNKNSGYITYALPSDFAFKGSLSEITISLELCSETNGYNLDFPSDITFSLNDIELCTFLSVGDFGDHYGKFTPPWWFSESTKYGVLTTISIKENGVYLNEKLVNKKVTLNTLDFTKSPKTTFKLQVKEDAEHVGGFNIFGEKFGEYNQAIVFTAIYK
jgi:predicted transcriptional regulator